MTYRLHQACGLAFAALLLCSVAEAQEGEFLKRFEGQFSGSGSVSRNESESATKVRCKMNGSASADAVSMSGTCRAAIIFSRKISAELHVDGSGAYTGAYTGSSIGPAALSGQRTGDAVNLTITWPQPVRGDTSALMTIRNDGNGAVSITITDEVPAGGPKTQVSHISLSPS